MEPQSRRDADGWHATPFTLRGLSPAEAIGISRVRASGNALGFLEPTQRRSTEARMPASYGKQLQDAIREFLPSSFFRIGRCAEAWTGRLSGSLGRRC